MEKAVCLLSGGIDSSTTAVIAKSRGFSIYGLTFLYGQRHTKEIECARKVAERLGVEELREVTIELPWGGSALTDSHLDVPTTGVVEGQIPVTYVPLRNTIFLSFAASYAEVIGAESIFAGMNVLDYSGYPDCRPEYIYSMMVAFKLGSKAGVEKKGVPFQIYTPLMHMTKAQIVSFGKSLGFDYSLTWSCYKGGELACGKCDSCRLRLEGFRKAKLEDPIKYE